MDIKDIPLILTNFNQFSYLRNLVNQFHFYYPENKIFVIDNASTSEQVKNYYWQNEEITVFKYPNNTSAENLRHFLDNYKFEYYVISDPDISIHPTTPPFFLEVFKELIDTGYHHAGFDLIYEDIPEWNKKAGWIQGDERLLHNQPVEVKYNGSTFTGFQAAIDTTFAMYKTANGGWQAPMSAENWTNSIRIFQAQHLTWYLHPEYVNAEMKNYFATCRRFEPGQVSAGKNNYRVE